MTLSSPFLVLETCYANRDEKVAYFRNEEYPEVQSETNYCSYGLKARLERNMKKSARA